MKIQGGGWRQWIGSATIGFCVLALILLASVPGGKSAPFGIKPGAITETNFSLTITNGASTNYYEIYVYDFLQSGAQFIRTVPGDVGQTNFTIETEGYPWLFYKAAVDNDWDDDLIPNIHDADPRDTNYGALTITIESPSHGSNLQ